mmetsp:Transcript_101247/g.174853  ORF Transcript_101247/g.174853 Transcript_101247/m.174853 type:complete len:138 (+) Transcript_101247:541-954(+)
MLCAICSAVFVVLETLRELLQNSLFAVSGFFNFPWSGSESTKYFPCITTASAMSVSQHHWYTKRSFLPFPRTNCTTISDMHLGLWTEQQLVGVSSVGEGWGFQAAILLPTQFICTRIHDNLLTLTLALLEPSEQDLN